MEMLTPTPPLSLKKGGTIEGPLVVSGGTRNHSTGGVQGEAGFFELCEIKNTGRYANQPVRFSVAQRGGRSGDIIFSFNNYNNTSPQVLSLYQTGNLMPVYVQKVDNTTWRILIQKSENYDQAECYNLCGSDYLFKNGVYLLSLTWLSSQLSSFPSDVIQATTPDFNF